MIERFHKEARKQNKNVAIGIGEKVLSVAYALKDAVGVSFAGLPIRANEVAMILTTGVNLIKFRSRYSTKRDTKLFLFLAINLIYVCIQGIINFNTIDTSFFIKYAVRNFLYVLVLLCFSLNKKTYSQRDIIYQCKAIVILNVVFGGILYITGNRLYLGQIFNTRTSNYSMLSLFGLRIPRFFGTASEAGYLGPFFMMPLYYFYSDYIRNRTSRIELICLGIMILLTFSAIVYALAVAVCIFALINQGSINGRIRMALFLLLFLVAIVIAYSSIKPFSDFVDGMFLNKIKAILGLEGYWDFSGSDRNNHFTRCLNLFSEQPIMQKVFGIGTGGYARYVQGQSGVLLEAQEAYNIYISTLLDRGIIGIVLLICTGYEIAKYRISDDPISNAIYAGIFSQYIHWMITGNMWLCYFWIEVLYLIGYNRYIWRGKNE